MKVMVMEIVSKDVQLHVSDSGEGDTTMLFQHHWGGSSRIWSQVIAALRDRFRCVAIDARGVIRRLGLKRYILIGHSMGGKASQLLASKRPEGLVGLVPAASSPLATMIGDFAGSL